MMLWALGVAVMALRLLFGWLRIRRIVRASRPVTDEAILNVAQSVARSMGLRRLPELRLTEDGLSPFTVGVLRSTVVLPEALARGMGCKGLSAILAHEYAHLMRRDALWGWLVALSETVWYFHPALWLARQRILMERERACDEWVLAARHAERSDYAEALVRTAELCAPSRPAPLLSTSQSFRQLKRRLRFLTAPVAPRRLPRAAVAALLLFGVLSLPGIELTQRPAAAAEEPAAQPAVADQETVTYAGTVVDPDGKPVAGAKVWSEMSGHARPLAVIHEEPTAETDANGRFRLGPLPKLPERKAWRSVLVDASPYAIGGLCLIYVPDADPNNLRIQLAPADSVAGRIEDGDGKPIAGACVTSTLWPGADVKAPPLQISKNSPFACFSDADGKFELARVPQKAGLHLFVEKDGFVWYNSLFGGQRATPFAYKAGTRDASIVMQRGGVLRGRLIHKGAPYTAAPLTLFVFGPSGRAVAWGDSNADGTFLLQGIPAGTCQIRFMPRYLESYSLAYHEPKSFDIKAGETVGPVDVPLEDAEGVEGIVTDIDRGVPLPGKMVKIRFGDNPMVGLPDTRTGPDGRFRICLKPGKYLVCWHSWSEGEVEEVRKAVTIERGRGFQTFNIALRQRSQIRGRLVDPDGNPVAGAVYFKSERVETKPTGGFAFWRPAIEDGSDFFIACDHAGKLTCAMERNWNTQEEDVVLCLQPGSRITGRLVGEDGAPVSDGNIALEGRLKNGMLYRYTNAPWRTTLKKDGTFALSPVPVGMRLTFRYDQPGYQARSEFETTAGVGEIALGDVKVRLLLKGGPPTLTGHISGRVLDEKNSGMAGVTVQAFVANIRRRVKTDAKGQFRLTELPVGEKVQFLAAWEHGYVTCSMHDTPVGSEDLILKMLPQGRKWYGKPAPELRAEEWFNSKPLQLSDLKGQVVLLIMPVHKLCEKQARDFATTAQGYSKQGVRCIMIHHPIGKLGLDEVRREDIVKWIKQEQVSLPVAIDMPPSAVAHLLPNGGGQGGATAAIYGAYEPPALYLIDKRGLVRCSPTRKNLTEWIEKLLAE